MRLLQIILVAFLLFSCRGESAEDIQKIDQILRIYIKNAAGTDLLNKESSGAYYSVELKDLGALQDRVSVSAPARTDDGGVKFLEYTAGAARVLQDNSTDSHKIYKSDIAVQYKTEATAEIVEDRMQIFYDSTPQAFQISSVIYNNQVVFQKVEGQPNIITIVK